jgi:hypothetical protein
VTAQLRFVLDTSVVAAASTPGERWHIDAAALDEAAKAGAVLLGVGTAFGYDLETAPESKQGQRMRWLVDRPYVVHLSGPMTLGVSALGMDALAGDDHAQVMAVVAQILGKRRQPEETAEWRRKYLDAHHVTTLVQHGWDALVTTDQRDLLSKATRLWEQAHVRVLDPGQALAEVGESD